MSRRIGRRPPPVLPPIRALLRTGSKEDLYRLGAELERYLREITRDAYLGLPAPHSHDDDGGVSAPSTGSITDDAEMLAWMAFLGDC